MLRILEDFRKRSLIKKLNNTQHINLHRIPKIFYFLRIIFQVSKYASRAAFKYVGELPRNENTYGDVRFGFYEKWVKATLPQPRPMV